MDDSNLIIQTFEKDMNLKAVSIHEFENVPNNSVFKIDTEKGSYIFKVYSKRDWPEDGKIPFIDRKLNEYHIPHAKVFVFSRDNEDFPNGYLIEEYLSGTTADRLALSHSETVKLFEKLSILVSELHKIELTGYGYIGGTGVCDYSSHSEFMYDVLCDNIATLVTSSGLEITELQQISTVICEGIKKCDILPPVLCHGDLSTKNIMVHSGKITLIDWDDTQSLCWVSDIARFTFWLRMNYNKHTALAYRSIFLDRYETMHDKNIYYETEDVFHVWYALDYLTFFTVGSENEKVKRLLNESREKCGI